MPKHSTTGHSGPDRLPPHDKDAERAVIGQVLLAGKIPPEAQALLASDFYVLLHSQVWAAIRRLEADDIAIDLISTKNALSAGDENYPPGRLAAELAAILDARWNAANLSYYVDIIKTKATLRAVINASSRITDLAFAGSGNSEDLLAAAEKQVEVLRGDLTRQDHLGFPLRFWDLSTAAMERAAQVDWLVEPIMAQPDVVTLIGDGGVGKSKSAAGLALAVAFGKPLWGHFEIRRSGRVVYVNEERPDLTLRHLHTLAPSMGIDPGEIEKRIVLSGRATKTWRVTDPAACRALVRFIKQLGDVALIVWDSLHVLHDKEENDNAQMTQVIEQFRSICMETNTCGVLLHHTGKTDFGDAGLSARGATAIKDTVDAQFVLRRPDREKQDEIRVAQDKTRRAIVLPFMLKLEHDERGDVLGVRWVGKAPTKAEQALPAVLEVISAAPPPLKSGEVALKLAKQFRKDDVYAALTLVRAGNLAPWSGNETRGFVYGAEAEPDGA